MSGVLIYFSSKRSTQCQSRIDHGSQRPKAKTISMKFLHNLIGTARQAAMVHIYQDTSCKNQTKNSI